MTPPNSLRGEVEPQGFVAGATNTATIPTRLGSGSIRWRNAKECVDVAAPTKTVPCEQRNAMADKQEAL